jgi:predicted glycosyltransferase
MKVWFDFTNSPHVSFFKQLIGELKEEGHEVIITCRPLGNTIPLLKLYNLPYHIVGTHYGKANLNKILGFPIRIIQLYKFLKKNKPDIAIAQASYYLPVVAKLLGVRSIYTNDNEHAKGNLPAFVCATKILIPEFLDKSRIKGLFVREDKIIQYPGIKEGIYLWNKFLDFSQEKTMEERNVYIRMEPSLAQYYNGGSYFLDNVILELKDKVKIIIIPREKEQGDHYLNPKFSGVTVLEKPETFEEITGKCALFIGAGGTMTREMAVVGVPTISVYQDKLLMVDEYLIKLGLMKHCPKTTAEDILTTIKERSNDHSADKTLLLNKGREAYTLIKKMLQVSEVALFEFVH